MFDFPPKRLLQTFGVNSPYPLRIMKKYIQDLIFLAACDRISAKRHIFPICPRIAATTVQSGRGRAVLSGYLRRGILIPDEIECEHDGRLLLVIH